MTQVITQNSVLSRIYNPLFLDPLTGFATGIPSDSILDIGGVVGPTFTVGGKELLFVDGTSTGGGTSSVNLQTTYEHSAAANVSARIDLISGKDFIIDSFTGPGVSFKIDSVTGTVTIGGDLVVTGTHTIVESTSYTSDHIQLSAQSPLVPAFWIGPLADQNVPSTDLIVVSIIPGSSQDTVFKIDRYGTTVIDTLRVSRDLNVVGKINDVDIGVLATSFNRHIYVDGSFKHLAKEINIDPSSFSALPNTVVRNVQGILENLDNSINTIDAQVRGLHVDVDNLQVQITDIVHNEVGEPNGYTFFATEPLSEWVIQHNKNSKNFVFAAFDGDGFMFQPNSAQMVDSNTVIMKFGVPQIGQVNMIFYKSNLF
jgi:hypothetical protein